MKTIVRSNNPEIITTWIEKIENLKTANVISQQDAETLKGRLIKENV
jgi:hypothetical protein